MSKPEVSKDANSVPGFPQDAFMEGPMMAMDQMVDKPENYGLRPGWSAFMAGMIFNLGNMLLMAATSVAGMSVAFPLALGTGLLLTTAIGMVANPEFKWVDAQRV